MNWSVGQVSRPRLEAVFAKLRPTGALQDVDCGALLGALPRMLEPGGSTIHPGDRRLIILEGWAALCRKLPDGRRQIFHFLLPGDVATSRALRHPSDCIVVLCPVTLVDAEALGRLLSPQHAACLLQGCDEASLRQDELAFDHLVRLGQHAAAERMANLMLELHDRLGQVGMAEPDTFAAPLKQEHLAECLGMTLVHVNRTLQKLKSEGLLVFKSGRVIITDPVRLAELAGRAPPEPADLERRLGRRDYYAPAA